MATGKLYAKGMLAVLKNIMDLDGSAMRCSLHVFGSSIGTYPQTAHQYQSSVTGEVANGNGYATGGFTVGSQTATQAGTTLTFDCGDGQWTNATISAYYAVLFNASGAASTSWDLLAYVDLGGTQTSSAGTFTIAWSTGGVFTIDVV
jgi:hypothetical protein